MSHGVKKNPKKRQVFFFLRRVYPLWHKIWHLNLSSGLPLTVAACLTPLLSFFPLMTTSKRHFLWAMTSQCASHAGRGQGKWREERSLGHEAYLCFWRHMETHSLGDSLCNAKIKKSLITLLNQLSTFYLYPTPISQPESCHLCSNGLWIPPLFTPLVTTCPEELEKCSWNYKRGLVSVWSE